MINVSMVQSQWLHFCLIIIEKIMLPNMQDHWLTESEFLQKNILIKIKFLYFPKISKWCPYTLMIYRETFSKTYIYIKDHNVNPH